MRRYAIVVLVALCISVPALVRAANINFDPDGAAPGNGASTIGALDFSPGNGLMDNVFPHAAGNTFQLFYQARLGGLVNSSGNPVTPTGLNSTFEITAVSSVTQVITSVGTNSFTYAPAGVQSANSFVEIWFDSTPDANPLAGTGYNDGTRILLGAPSSALGGSGALSAATGAAVPFDQFGTNDYPGVNSISSSGGDSWSANVTSFDPAFFTTSIIQLSLDTAEIAPFDATNPSGLFAGLPGGVAPALVPARGTINGSSGPDFQLQTDANMSFVVPEPAVTAWVLACTGVMCFGRRRHHN